MPKKVVGSYVQMRDPCRHAESVRAEHRYDVYALPAVLDLVMPAAS